ncbi:MAG: ribosome silencing factor, partial [bacterium]
MLDVSALTHMTDYFVFLCGSVDQHVKAIAEFIEDTLTAQGFRAHHIEGKSNLDWVLMDYIDVIVHIFRPDIRKFYDLDSLWGEAETVP